MPLSLRNRDHFLLVIGILTLGWVVGGWVTLRMARRVRPGRERVFAANQLQLHIVCMGSSYIAAWTAFLANVHPLSTGPVLFWSMPWGRR